MDFIFIKFEILPFILWIIIKLIYELLLCFVIFPTSCYSFKSKEKDKNVEMNKELQKCLRLANPPPPLILQTTADEI